MYKYLLKRDSEIVTKYYLIIFGILIISIVMTYIDADAISFFAFNVLVGTIFLTEAFFVDVATRITIKKDLSQSNYYLTKVEDFGLYINYKFFLNFILLLIVLSISYIIFLLVAFLLAGSDILSMDLEVYYFCVYLFLVWSFKITLFTTVINNFLLLRKVTNTNLSTLYLAGGMMYWVITITYWRFNSYWLFSIRMILAVFVINYICGMIINHSRKIR